LAETARRSVIQPSHNSKFCMRVRNA